MSDSMQVTPLNPSTAIGTTDPYAKNIQDIMSLMSTGRDARLAIGDRVTAAEQALALMTALTAKIPTFGKINVKPSLPAIQLAVAGMGPSVAIAATGVKLGDWVRVAFDGAPPANLTIVGETVTADATVLVTFAATGVVALTAGVRSLNVSFWR